MTILDRILVAVAAALAIIDVALIYYGFQAGVFGG